MRTVWPSAMASRTVYFSFLHLFPDISGCNRSSRLIMRKTPFSRRNGSSMACNGARSPVGSRRRRLERGRPAAALRNLCIRESMCEFHNQLSSMHLGDLAPFTVGSARNWRVVCIPLLLISFPAPNFELDIK
jgi:hypothetical protein